MGFPRLDVRLDIVQQNAIEVLALCSKHGIDITGVTKACTGAPEIAQAFVNAGIRRLGDARIENLKRLEPINAEKWLIRIPMPAEAEDVVRYADVSLNSEWDTIRLLDIAAGKQGKIHKVILMADLGDLREGYTDADELLAVAARTAALKHTLLFGVGTNLSCFSFIHPDAENTRQLVELARKLPIAGIPVVSGGNSASLHLMLQGGIVEGVNNFRLGESLLFGKERCCYTFLPQTRRDAFILRAYIVELKRKPSVPWGETGVDSYGNAPPKREDKGPRLRAILALGKQDSDMETMRPIDSGIELLGASSDHMVLDVTDSCRNYRVGDVVAFELGYFATMRAYTSTFVEKRYLSDAPQEQLAERT